MYIFVNGRVVKCPVVIKAIDTAYKNMLPAGKYPFVCLNLTLQAQDVDVNVHPTKREVRYKNPNLIFNFVYSAITGALSAVSPYAGTAPETSDENTIKTLAKNQKPDYNNFVQTQEVRIKTGVSHYVDNTTVDDETKNVTAFADPKLLSDTPFSFKTDNVRPVEKIPEIAPYTIIGQYLNTYIIFEENRVLNIVDQHIADERYIFEKLKAQAEKENVPSQLLMISDVIRLEANETALLLENKEKLAKYGYGIEQVSDTEIVFKKVPQVISHFKPQEIISDILENLHGDLNNLEEKMLVTMSCKAAVKAGQELNLWQMEELIKKWKTTENPYTCPHGRPILHTMSEKEIASFFHRTPVEK